MLGSWPRPCLAKKAERQICLGFLAQISCHLICSGPIPALELEMWSTLTMIKKENFLMEKENFLIEKKVPTDQKKSVPLKKKKNQNGKTMSCVGPFF